MSDENEAMIYYGRKFVDDITKKPDFKDNMRWREGDDDIAVQMTCELMINGVVLQPITSVRSIYRNLWYKLYKHHLKQKNKT